MTKPSPEAMEAAQELWENCDDAHELPVLTRERPILFSGEMVRAILAGRKTQTRRIAKLPPGVQVHNGLAYTTRWDEAEGHGWRQDYRCPYGQPGDRLWVRETWAVDVSLDEHAPSSIANYTNVRYAVDGTLRKPRRSCDAGRSRSSIHMPRWASRITLEITNVRAQRLQDITEEDAKAEGMFQPSWGRGAWHHGIGLLDHPVPELALAANLVANPDGCLYTTPRAAFQALWDIINGPGAWERNDFVWPLTFREVSVAP